MPIPEYYAAEHNKAVAEAIAEGIPAEAFAALDALTDEQRRTVFWVYCIHCGAANTNCYCAADC